MVQVPERLFNLVSSRDKHLWIGANPPFDFDSVLLSACSNYRAPAELHQRFDVVWCYEQSVCSFRIDQHLLLLDELIRFVGHKGVIVLRFSLQLGGLMVKNVLGRRPGLKARVLHEEEDAAGYVVSIIEIERLDLEKYRPAPWTFGVLTQNTRKPNVIALLKSVREHDPANEHEILICGPEDADYAFASPRYLPQDYSAVLPEISRKKNDIAKAATRPNLLLVHDRYRLDDNFFKGFLQYGYDFDFLAIAQYFENGDAYPAYCHLEDDYLHMTPPSAVEDYNSIRATSFVNGGLIVVKTHLLRQFPLNELCFWNQAEDVEYGATLIRNGVPPRYNPYSSATTLGIDKGHVTAYVPAKPVKPPQVKPDWLKNAREAGQTVVAEPKGWWRRLSAKKRDIINSRALGALLIPAVALFRLVGR